MSDPAPSVPSQDPSTESTTRTALIFGAVGLLAAIVFGLLYLFVLAPTVPDGNVGWYLFAFATGLTMIVLPCTLPLAFVIVPLSMGKGLVKGLGMALAFGIGVAATLSIYGILAALVGGVAIDSLGGDIEPIKNWVYFIAGIFAFVFALGELGLINVHMPTYSGAAPAFIQKRSEVIKAFLLGLFLGNVGIGCPHPATPLILIEIASSGDVLYGWTMFLFHAVGRVLPLLLLAFLAILGVNGLSWLLARKESVERVTGWAMVFVAGFILTLGLFTHDWWVNSGLHSGLETLTQEAYFNELLNDTLDQDVAHLHGLEEGEGLFGLPLEWGSWFLVILWLIPIWWWWARKRKHLLESPGFKVQRLRHELDKIEDDIRSIEAAVGDGETDGKSDLQALEADLKELKQKRQALLTQIEQGEQSVQRSPIARQYEARILGMQRNFFIILSIFLALVFIHYMPTNFYLKSTGPDGHDDHGAAAGDHGHDATEASSYHVMPDGSVMDHHGEVVPGAHQMPDGSIMLPDGTTVASGGAGGMNGPQGTAFTGPVADLPDAVGVELVELADGDTYDITAEYVKKEVGNRTLRMMAYNRSVPGPIINAPQGAEVTINFTNNTDIDQTVHSHGIRIDNRSDGVPFVTQDPVTPGQSFTYTVRFPDAGVYWYHPHTREDYGQELGLYGNYLIEPSDPNYWSPVNREIPLVIDDILISNGEIEDFYQEFTNFALLGRFGNTHLVNGVEDYTRTVTEGEVVRFYITNVANSRPYQLSIPGARLKLVGADLGKYERETYVEKALISPAERVVVEAYFPEAGTYKLMHVTPTEETEIARFLAEEGEPVVPYVEEFNTLRTNESVTEEFSTFDAYRNLPPDKELLLTIDLMPGMVDHSAHAHGDTDDHDNVADGGVDHLQHAHTQAGDDRLAGIQWDDPSQSDRTNTTDTILWQLKDVQTGAVNIDIDWTFKVNDLVKVRLNNDADADHVMQHPMHFHGQQFVVLTENGVPNTNLAWKDTVLVFPGETVDVLVDMNNPGVWMSHCHIAEHLHAGMMLGFRVENDDGSAPGDDYRATVSDEEMATVHGDQHMHSDNSIHDHSSVEKMPSGMMNEPVRGSEVTTVNQYTYDDTQLTDITYSVKPDSSIFRSGRELNIPLSFYDSAGNPVNLSDTARPALIVSFVKSDDTVSFVTYPGNSTFPVPTGDTADDHGEDDGHDHEHSLLSIPVAYAHGEAVGDGHHAGTVARTYSVPVIFPERGVYRGFVEFILEGESEPRVAYFDVEVSGSGFSVDQFGWSDQLKWWVLVLGSLILMVPLVLGVRRFITVDKKKV